jgi:hypothetical protein
MGQHMHNVQVQSGRKKWFFLMKAVVTHQELITHANFFSNQRPDLSYKYGVGMTPIIRSTDHFSDGEALPVFG